MKTRIKLLPYPMVLPLGSLVVVYGNPGSGKTRFVMNVIDRRMLVHFDMYNPRRGDPRDIAIQARDAIVAGGCGSEMLSVKKSVTVAVCLPNKNGRPGVALSKLIQRADLAVSLRSNVWTVTKNRYGSMLSSGQLP